MYLNPRRQIYTVRLMNEISIQLHKLGDTPTCISPRVIPSLLSTPRRLSFLLSLAAAALYAAFVTPLALGATLLVDDGFEGVAGTADLSVGPYAPPSSSVWVPTGVEEGTVVYTKASGLPVHSGDQSLRLLGVASSAVSLSTTFQTQTTGLVSISFWLYVPLTTANTRIANFSARGSGTSNNSPYIALFGGTGGLGTYDSSGNFNKLTDVVFDQWTSFSIVVDIAKKTYEIGYNGVVYSGVDGAGFGYYRSANNIASFYAVMPTGGLIYMDDFTVGPPIPEPAMAMMLIPGLALIGVGLRQRSRGRLMPGTLHCAQPPSHQLP